MFAGRSKYVALAFAIIGVGLLTRLSPPGHYVLLKYLGSALWGGMVYCLMASFTPKSNPIGIAIIAIIVAAGVEFSQLWHTETLDAFRATRIGVLLVVGYRCVFRRDCGDCGVRRSRAAPDIHSRELKKNARLLAQTGVDFNT